MGCKRQRAGELSRRRLSLALTALAWAAATTVAASSSADVHVGDGSLRIRSGDAVVPLVGPARLRWRRVLAEINDAVGTVHAENDDATAAADSDSENREGSNSGPPTLAPSATTTAPVPSTTAPTPSSVAPTPTPTTTAPTTSRPPTSSSSSRGDETLAPVPAPSSAAPPPVVTTAPPPPPMTETTTPPPPSTTPAPAPSTTPSPSTPPTTEDATAQPAPTSPAPSSVPPSPPPPAETTPAPTTSAPSTAPPAPSTTAPPPAPAPTSAPPAAPPATTPAPTQARPPTATTPAPTTPKATTPAPAPTTAKPSSTPPAPTTPAPTTKAPTATPSLTPTLTTKAPVATLTKAPSNAGASGAGASSGADDTAASDSTHDGNEKVKAPDLSSLAPITAGSGVIAKSNRTPSPGSGDGSDTASATQNKTPTAGLNNISTLGIAGIVVGVLAVVLLAILFVHVRRKRNEKDEDSARQRQFDDFFSGDHRAPVPRSGHPGAASLISNSSNGMTFVAPPRDSLTPRDEIPIASSARFKQAPAPPPLPPRPMSPNAVGHGAPARFDDNVLSQGRIVPKGRMYPIAASPSHGGDSSSGEYNESSNGDSFMGTGEHSFYDNSNRQASEFSLRSSGAESRETAFSHTTSEARSTAYFPQGLSESRSTMVQMGLAHQTALPRGDAGDILIPVPRPGAVSHDDASTTFSVSDSEYGSPEPRDVRVDSSISSSSNQNPWALLTLDDALARSISPPTSIDESAATGSSRGESQASALSDLPSSRSDNSYYMSDEEGDGRSTRAGSEFDVDSYGGSARGDRTDSYAYTADSFTSGEGSARSARTDSYGYANSSFGDGSHLSFLSDTRSDSTAFRPSQSGGPDVLEGHI